MERKPLAEESAWAETIPYGFEMFCRIERAGSAARRVEIVGHDHVVSVAGGTHEAPASAVITCKRGLCEPSPNIRLKIVEASMTSGNNSTASTSSIASSAADEAVTPVPSPRKSARRGDG